MTWIQWFHAGSRSRDQKTEETEEYLDTMDCHAESVKNERLAITKCVNCIISYLLLWLWPGPLWFKKWFPLTIACSGGLTKNTVSLFRHSDRFEFVFSLRCID